MSHPSDLVHASTIDPTTVRYCTPSYFLNHPYFITLLAKVGWGSLAWPESENWGYILTHLVDLTKDDDVDCDIVFHHSHGAREHVSHV